jgi:hypothetical protein
MCQVPARLVKLPQPLRFISLLNGSDELLHLGSSLVVDEGSAPFSYPGPSVVKAPSPGESFDLDSKQRAQIK